MTTFKGTVIGIELVKGTRTVKVRFLLLTCPNDEIKFASEDYYLGQELQFDIAPVTYEEKAVVTRGA